MLTVSMGAVAAQPSASDGSNLSDGGNGSVVERLVHFESTDVANSSSNTAEFKSSLQHKTETAQQPFVQRAEKTPGLTIERQFWIANVALVTIDTDKVSPSDVSSTDNVDTVTENHRVKVSNTTRTETTSTNTDSGTNQGGQPTLDTTYGLDQIDVPEVWDTYDTRGEDVRVAILDTGVDPGHPDIELTDSEGWAEWDIQGDRVDTAPQDYGPDGHGTHVSGTVAGGNASGTHIGVAPDAELMHGAVLNQCEDACYGSTTQILSGMEWAVSNDADVLSMSLGGDGYYESYIQAIDNAERSGTVVIAASGNRGNQTSDSPGNVYDAVAVGATDQYKSVADFSSGEQIVTNDVWSNPPADWPDEYVVPDLVAPGVSINSAAPDGDYQSLSGTSMATPHTAGVAVLMESGTEEDLEPEEIKYGLSASTEDINEPEVRSGEGLVNAEEAVSTFADQPDRDVEYYATNEGRVNTNNLFIAIADWRENEISDELLQEVITFWRSGDTV